MKDINFVLLLIFGVALAGYFITKSSNPSLQAGLNGKPSVEARGANAASAEALLAPHFPAEDLELIRKNISENNPAYYDYEIQMQ